MGGTDHARGSIAREIVVAAVEPSRTFALRQAVLRPHQRVEEMHLPGSEQTEAAAFAASLGVDGEVLSTGAVAPEPLSDHATTAAPPGRQWRLRSMATRPEWRSSGLGTEVLRAVVAHVARHGGGLLWCHARTPAVSFYERAGFVVVSGEWIEPEIGPHVMMWRTVDPAAEGGDRP